MLSPFLWSKIFISILLISRILQHSPMTRAQNFLFATKTMSSKMRTVATFFHPGRYLITRNMMHLNKIILSRTVSKCPRIKLSSCGNLFKRNFPRGTTKAAFRQHNGVLRNNYKGQWEKIQRTLSLFTRAN